MIPPTKVSPSPRLASSVCSSRDAGFQVNDDLAPADCVPPGLTGTTVNSAQASSPSTRPAGQLSPSTTHSGTPSCRYSPPRINHGCDIRENCWRKYSVGRFSSCCLSSPSCRCTRPERPRLRDVRRAATVRASCRCQRFRRDGCRGLSEYR